MASSHVGVGRATLDVKHYLKAASCFFVPYPFFPAGLRTLTLPVLGGKHGHAAWSCAVVPSVSRSGRSGGITPDAVVTMFKSEVASACFLREQGPFMQPRKKSTPLSHLLPACTRAIGQYARRTSSNWIYLVDGCSAFTIAMQE